MLSVIIPVYNTEKYLRRCLDSIVNQTYKELKIILVDDGSTDSSGMICDEYAKKYENIFVYHQENQGVVVARNQGIAIAKSEYITFVDSDDWLDVDFYERLFSYLNSTDVDMVTSGMILEWENKKKIITDTIAEGIYQKEEIKNNIWNKMAYDLQESRQGITASLWNKIFKKEILESLMKNIDLDIRYGEDGAVVYTLLTKAEKIIVTHYCGYHYVQHDDSSIHTYSEKSFGSILTLQKCMKREMLGINKDNLLESQINFYVESLLKVAIKSVYGISVKTSVYLFPFHKVLQYSKIILYGAGEVGKSYYKCLEDRLYATVIAWVDKNYKQYDSDIQTPDVIIQKEFDYIVIAIDDRNIANEIKCNLENIGISKDKIIWEKPKRIL